jgi:YidC/Oxa1 family membrane protein insertase
MADMILCKNKWKGPIFVNKNTFLAFLLILLTIFLFQFFESKTNKKEHNQQQPSSQQIHAENGNSEQKASEPERPKPTESGVSLSILDTMKVMPVIGDTFWVENDKIRCAISEIGARIISLTMKEYGYERVKLKQDVPITRVDIIGRSSVGGGNLSIDGQDFDAKLFKLQENEKRVVLSNHEKKSFTFSFTTPDGNVILKRYSFEGNSYRIRLEILSSSLDGKNITVGWKCGITESEFYKANSAQYSNAYVNEQRKVHVFDGKNIDHIQQKKPDRDEKTGFYKWAAITSKYFMVGLVADSVKDADLTIEGYDSKTEDDVKAIGKKEQVVDYSISIKRSGDGNREGYWIFAGPSQLSILSSYKVKFEKVLFGGWEWLIRADIWFPIICEWTLWLLLYINNIVKDYGLTIIILTIITRAVTFPLSQSSMKSMNRMKLLQPKITHLRDRYKNNPKKMNEEIMTLYRQEGINPLNPGCLPMFLQMPILFALFIVLQKAIELRGAHTWMVPWVHDLSQPEILISLQQVGLDKMFPTGIPLYGYGIAIMPIAMAVLTFFQQKMTIKDPNQKAMIYFMPVFMLVIFNNFPAGLVFYWTFSNALGILQQFILDKSMRKEAAAYQQISEKTHTGKKGKR